MVQDLLQPRFDAGFANSPAASEMGLSRISKVKWVTPVYQDNAALCHCMGTPKQGPPPLETLIPYL